MLTTAGPPGGGAHALTGGGRGGHIPGVGLPTASLASIAGPALATTVLVATPLAALAAVLFARLYRRATLRGMTEVAGAPPVPEAAPVGGTPPELRLVAPAAEGGPHPLSERVTASGRRVLWRYLAGGAAYALTLSAAVLAGGGIGPLGAPVVLVIFAWPAVVTLLVAVVHGGRARMTLLGGYGVALVAAVALGVAVIGPEGFGLGLSWLYFAGLPTVLLLAFLVRPIRAVGPLMALLATAAVGGAVAILSLSAESDSLVAGAAAIGGALGLGATGVVVGIGLLGLLVAGLIGAAALIGLGALYRRKAISDQELTADTMMVFFGVAHAIELSPGHPAYLLAGPGAAVAYRVVYTAVRRLTGESATGPPPELLMLRVFSLGRRSEALYRALGSSWRRAGPIAMIAGPDLMVAALEPDEFLAFAAGAHARRFVTGADDLRTRLANADRAPDADGRYRVNEFFCRDDTWRMTMVALAARADAILMDLRSFSRDNRGCIFEIEQLLGLPDLDRVTLLIDDSTDEAFLRDTVARLWPGAATARGSEPARLVIADAGRAEAPVSQLLARLLPRPHEDAASSAPGLGHQ